MINIKNIAFTIALIGCTLFAQARTIHCYAPQYKGQKVQLKICVDHITQRPQTIAESIVDSTGHAKINYDYDQSIRAELYIQNKKGIIYLDDDTENYYVGFPYDEATKKQIRPEFIPLVFDSLSIDDINSLILDYTLREDIFLFEDDSRIMLVMSKSQAYRDSLTAFTEEILETYKDVEDPYFKDYIENSIALLKLDSDRFHPERKRADIYHLYLRYTEHDFKNERFAALVSSVYSGLFTSSHILKRSLVENKINTLQDLQGLDDLMAEHFFLKRDTLREYVMVNALSEAYHSGMYDKLAITKFLEYLKENGKNEDIRLSAGNVLYYQQRLLKGSEAPIISWQTKEGDIDTLSFDGYKYTYLTFYSSWHPLAVQEQQMIANLKEKYGKHVHFVSICLDPTRRDFDIYLYKNRKQKMNWTQGYYQGNNDVLEAYAIRSSPSYIFINPNGKILQAPALAPAMNGTYKSIDETMFNIKREREPKSRFRVGGRAN